MRILTNNPKIRWPSGIQFGNRRARATRKRTEPRKRSVSQTKEERMGHLMDKSNTSKDS